MPEIKFETLKKSHKKQIVIGALVVCVVGGALTFATTRAKYKLTESIPLVSGEINYKPYDFKIMAMYQSEDGTNYTEIDEMPVSGYVINESKSYCNMTNGSQDNTAVLKTIDGNHTIGKLKYNDRCYLYFDKYSPPITIPDIIAAVNPKDATPDFSQIADTDEGVYSVADPVYGGTSYYWRGAVTNNYVKFANKCWRIVRINGDGSIRLIYDGTSCHANGTSTTDSLAIQRLVAAYNPSCDRSEYVGWTYSTGSQRTTSGSASNIKNQTDTWYGNNITGANAEKVADGKYCNDRNTASGYSWSSQPSSTFYYAARGRLESAKTPTLACPDGDVYTMKVGAITADEVAFAGGVYGSENSSYYLYNSNYYWTMSPFYYSNAAVFYVNYDGQLAEWYVSWTDPGVRPVINLKADTLFKEGGTGTQNNPYVTL